MMKKVILCTGFSLLVFSGFVAGPWGSNLVGAGTAVAAKCSDLPNVEACILIMKGGEVKVVEGKGKKLRLPKKGGVEGAASGLLADPPKIKDRKDLPDELKEEIITAQYIENTITIYGDKTCMKFNGSYYCW